MRAHRRTKRPDDELAFSTLRPSAGSTALRSRETAVLDLQHQAGNHAVAQMLSGSRSEGSGSRYEDVVATDETEEPDWDAPIESEADERTEERAEDGPAAAAAAPAPATPAAPTSFPGYASMRGNDTVRTAAWAAWKETLRTATATGRREQGFWVQWDGTTTPNATGTFRVVGATTGPVVTAAQGATISLGTKPADSGDWYTVGSFHTHTPTKHRTVGRPVGPSSADLAADTNDNVAGLVYDYKEAKNGNVPAKWPIWSEALIYPSGPRVRS